MKKRVVRLNESEMVRLVERIVKKVNKKPLREYRNGKRVIRENDWDETGFGDSPYSSEGDYLDSLDTYDMNDVYLQFYYSTGEEDYGDDDYDESQYVEGLLMSHMPRKWFIDIMGVEPEIGMEIEPFSDGGYDILDVMLRRKYLSINTKTGKTIEPDVQDGWTQGIITIIPFKEYEKKYNQLIGRWSIPIGLTQKNNK